MSPSCPGRVTRNTPGVGRRRPPSRRNPEASRGAAHHEIKAREFQDAEERAARGFRNGWGLDYWRVGGWRRGEGGWKMG